MVEPGQQFCRSCKAPVMFVRNEHGKVQIIDWHPSPKGNIWLAGSSFARVAILLSGQRLEETRASGADLYIDHHATCPEAESWRS